MTQTYTIEEKKMRIGDYKAFAVESSGDTFFGHKISTPSVFNGRAQWIELDGKKYQDEDLRAYQDGRAFYGAYKSSYGYIWCRQLKRGKINLYGFETSRRDPMSNRIVNDQHFVFQKGNGPMEEPNLERISELIKDDRKALGLFNEDFRPGAVFLPKRLEMHPKALFGIIDQYNAD
jgi:hypothetical protein